MLLQFSDDRHLTLQGELAEIRENYANEPERTKQCLAGIKIALEELTAKVKAHPFASKAEEAIFNKSSYVPLYTCYLYEVERFYTLDAKPRGKVKKIRKYHYGKVAGWMAYSAGIISCTNVTTKTLLN